MIWGWTCYGTAGSVGRVLRPGGGVGGLEGAVGAGFGWGVGCCSNSLGKARASGCLVWCAMSRVLGTPCSILEGMQEGCEGAGPLPPQLLAVEERCSWTPLPHAGSHGPGQLPAFMKLFMVLPPAPCP